MSFWVCRRLKRRRVIGVTTSLAFWCDIGGACDANPCRGFKGLKQAIKVEFRLQRYSDVRHYPTLPPPPPVT